jgi:putative toxin-antitoxin system antitoxin component (TIGR02293 family)
MEDATPFRTVLALLGGRRMVGQRVAERSDIHVAVVRGIPYASLFHLLGATRLSERDVATVLGMSERTLRRNRETPEKPMPADVGSKTWLFAETLAQASEVLGGQEQAERWLVKPTMGLDGQRPIDMLTTLQGAELVRELLTRLEYGVYS